MEPAVSKARVRLTRLRERQALRSHGDTAGAGHSRLPGFLLAGGLSAAVLLLLASGRAWEEPWTARVMLPALADAIRVLGGLIAVLLLLQVARPEGLRRSSVALLWGGITLIGLLAGEASLRLLAFAGAPAAVWAPSVLPFGLAPVLAALLLDGVYGFAAGLLVSLHFAVRLEHDLAVLCTGCLTSLTAVALARSVRSRSQLLRTTLIAALTGAVWICAEAAASGFGAVFHTFPAQILALLAAGVATAVGAAVLLPGLEWASGMASDLTLLRWSDAGHPLLQRLAVEAPGTYHHSLMVARLSEAAAEDIGANPLLARVGAYFHDVGKLSKPEFFAENIQTRASQHDRLQPSMSALVILSHVKEGLSLAALHRLPRRIADIIAQHHGTSLMAFFHHKAQREADAEIAISGANAATKVDERDFRYPGPRPTTAEAAIVGLADAVEAAARCMQSPTPHHIEGLVDDIVTSRLLDGQLDQAPLTMADLAAIRRSFAFSLINMFHGRIAYPTHESPCEQPTTAPARGWPTAGRPVPVLRRADSQG